MIDRTRAHAVVVPLDGTAHSLTALPVAERLAALWGATLHLLHVSTGDARPADLLARIGLGRAAMRGAVLSSHVGDPARGILESASELDAALIVMCTHTASPHVDDGVLGRSALSVLEHATCPVVLVGPECSPGPWALHRVLLPHDGSPTTSAAIRPAVELARIADADLDVVHVAGSRTGQPDERGTLTPPRYVDQPQHEWPAWVGEFIERLDSMCPLATLEVRMWLAQGVAGHEVLRVAEERSDDLIVLAWHGCWNSEHAGTMKAILRDARAPVMVVRADARVVATASSTR